jgi:predicted kinase
MPDNTASKRKLILITGIPGTGKTTYGREFASQFEFDHYDLEDEETRNRFFPNPAGFIDGIVRGERNAVVSWGFSFSASRLLGASVLVIVDFDDVTAITASCDGGH